MDNFLYRMKIKNFCVSLLLFVEIFFFLYQNVILFVAAFLCLEDFVLISKQSDFDFLLSSIIT